MKKSETLTVFCYFQGIEKGCIGNEWVKEIVYWRLPSLSIHWLIMRAGFEIKGSKPKSSVSRLNLFKVLIVSSTSFLQGCAVCSSDSSSSFSSSPSVILQDVQKIQKTIYSADNGRDWLVPSRTSYSRNVELNGNFFVKVYFSQTLSVLHTCF